MLARFRFALFALSLLAGTSAARSAAADLYWDVPIDAVEWTEELERGDELRLREAVTSVYSWSVGVRIVLEGGGEAYLNTEGPGTRLVARAPGVRGTSPLAGTFFREPAWGDVFRRDFTLTPGAATPDARAAFEAGRGAHHRALLFEGVAGGAWFRSEAGALAVDATGREGFRPTRDDAFESFSLFTGGRALAENLQLDRTFLAGRANSKDEEPVDLGSVPGIEIAAFDWEPLLEGLPEAGADPLLSWIPADQHVVLLPSFGALTALVDELEQRASPLVAALDSASIHAGSRATLEEQLGLSLDGLARVLGPAVVERVALTGGDPYMRLGTDVTLVFECRSADVVEAHVRAAHAAASKNGVPVAAQSAAGADGVQVDGVQDRIRRTSSFVARVERFVFVSNSRASLERTLSARTGANLTQLDETRFFLSRYGLEDARAGGDGAAEAAMLLVTDATLRRWCGPQWRIAAARRLRALALLLDVHAREAQRLVAGIDAPIELPDVAAAHPELGTVRLTSAGVHSSVYGAVGRMTPIVELALDTAWPAEVRQYERWRDGYARNWTVGFDPIGMRLEVSPGGIDVDVTVLPLIDRTDYRDLREWAGAARLGPSDGDPHAGALMQFAVAVDPKSPSVRELQGMLSGFAPDAVTDFMTWMTGAFSLSIDDDEVWDIALEAESFDQAIEDLALEFNDLPIALTIGSSSAFKLAAWLTALRGFVEGAGPGLTSWSTLTDAADQPYVKVGGQGPAEEFYLLYAALPEAWVLALSPGTLTRTMARFRERRETKPEAEVEQGERVGAWLGESAALRISRRGVEVLGAMGEFGGASQRQTYANLPILNEWRRLYPSADPVEIHRRVFGQELRCAAGGTFVWNAEWKTMESTALGHPGAQRKVEDFLPGVADFEQFEAGLTFEHDGLRARFRATR